MSIRYFSRDMKEGSKIVTKWGEAFIVASILVTKRMVTVEGSGMRLVPEQIRSVRHSKASHD